MTGLPDTIVSLQAQYSAWKPYYVSKNDELCINNEELCIENEEFCIKNVELCS